MMMTPDNRRVFILPRSFNPDELLPRPLHRYADDSRYLASTIIRKTARGQADRLGYVPLKAEYLRNVMSFRRGRDVVQALLDAEAIHRTPYKVGERSFAYRLADRYRGDPHIRRPVEDRRLLRRLDQHAAECRERARERMQPVHVALARRQQGLKIEGQTARSILESLPPESNPFDVQGVLVTDILEHRFRLSVGNYGRVANNITSMKREIRTALRCTDEPLAGVDIACCQPSLLALLMRSSLTHFNKNVTSYNASLCVPPLLLPVPPPALSLPSLSRFADACRSGELFAVLGVRVRDVGLSLSRGDLKRKFLADVLAKKKANRRGAEYPSLVEDVFRAEFPGVWTFIRHVNHGGWEHSRLIRILQQLESWLVIEQVCGRFVRRHPGELIVTIHDAAYVRPGMLGALVEVFDEIFEALDFHMTLKVEGPQ